MFTLLSSGSNAHGQLSNGSLEDSHVFLPCSFSGCPPGTMPPNTNRVLNISSGANHTIALLETRNSDGEYSTEIWGSGDGSVGQLGPAYRQLMTGASSTIFQPLNIPLQQVGLSGYQIKLVAASWETTYLVLSCEGKGDVLISMGKNDFGDLGIGENEKGKGTTRSLNLVSFTHLTVRGAQLNHAKIAIQSIAAGQHHVVAQIQATWSDGATEVCMVGWGASRHGQLGNALGANGRPVPYLSTPNLIPSGDPDDRIVTAALGNQHTVLLRSSGKVLGLGSNRKGQLQEVENAPPATQVGCTWNGTYIVVNEGEGISCVLSTGSGAHGQLGRPLTFNPSTSDGLPLLAPVQLAIPSNSINITAMACGTEHVLALLSPFEGSVPENSPEVWGWGWNEHGNLGTGTTEDVFVPVKVWPPASMQGTESPRTAIGIWAGSGTSWVLTC
ncbi:regulator of chromosome condensation 1/beta-lactamase-inhibitor protein II [Lyophyllum atratum]|nr:regulator of chromosome condensation 1/beta-lactamase-inhibitor protein II [Lyophyllum atratum]